MTDKLADILERLERVEAAVAGIGPDLDDPPATSDPNLEAHGRRVPTSMVALRYGVCARTLERWLAHTGLGFPKPDIVHNRRYWWLSELRDWDRAYKRNRRDEKGNAPKP